ncbi:unnamed protein product [Urochloa decumbens]|uniref:Uncharacterized protein n=1 Tax=Urochloa decumbens TaxID=240449 RepID=A0ABC8XCN2_9POAL
MHGFNHGLNNNINVGEAWPAWPDEHQEDNIGNQDDGVQQESISFDQSGSTAEYLRANGPDIVLNIDDILKGKMVAASSSSSSDDSITMAIPKVPSPSFQLAENMAFAKLSNISIPRVLQIPVSIDPVNNQKTASKRDHLVSDPATAIVPFQPTLHAVLITIWANAQNVESMEQGDEDISMDISSCSMEQATRKSICLPDIVSLDSGETPLQVSSVRRSTRISQKKDGYKNVQHIQLEDNPRKKRRVWREVALSPKEAALLLDKPPVPTDDEVPSEIPTETLKSWGLLCNVTPEELTNEILQADVPNDATA